MWRDPKLGSLNCCWSCLIGQRLLEGRVWLFILNKKSQNELTESFIKKELSVWTQVEAINLRCVWDAVRLFSVLMLTLHKEIKHILAALELTTQCLQFLKLMFICDHVISGTVFLSELIQFSLSLSPHSYKQNTHTTQSQHGNSL